MVSEGWKDVMRSSATLTLYSKARMRKQQGMTLSHVRRLDGVNRWKNKDLNKLKMFCDYLLRVRCRPKFQKDANTRPLPRKVSKSPLLG